MPNVIRIERGFYKGLAVGNGFRGEGSRITTSLNRGVLFNILINRFHLNLQNLSCADFCCGSGIVGFELMSLGCRSCTFVDCDRKKLNNIEAFVDKQNSQDLRKLQNGGKQSIEGITRFDVKCVYAFLPSFITNDTFDLIFFDPPYKNNFCQKTLDMIVDKNLLADEGMLILETQEDYDYSAFEIGYSKDLKNGAKFMFLCKKGK